jgi:pimeloyl-ACP methyl ester carboxylesterase
VLGTTLTEDIREAPALGPEDYARLGCPVVGVYADHGVVRPLDKMLVEVVPHATVRTVPGADHLAVLTHTRTLKEVLRAQVLTTGPGGVDRMGG